MMRVIKGWFSTLRYFLVGRPDEGINRTILQDNPVLKKQNPKIL